MDSCPFCNSKRIIKAGKVKLKREIVQRYFCKKCGKFFQERRIKNKSYPARIILQAISSYNSGYNLKEVKEILSRKFGEIPQSTIYSWIKDLSQVCTFSRIRNEILKKFKREEMILKQKFFHHQLYLFQMHQAKLDYQLKFKENKKFVLLKEYLLKVYERKIPEHIFVLEDEELEKRASQLKAKLLPIEKIGKESVAKRLAELSLNLAKNNRERHEKVENFFLINDSVTIATEIPVYLTKDDIKYFKNKGFDFDFENYRTPITGHIDILQIRNGLIYILDYKPEAEKVNAVNQLTIYSLALASRTKLAVKYFKAAWFDDKNYFEFYPLHAVYMKN
jgi:transposase-like protein